MIILQKKTKMQIVSFIGKIKRDLFRKFQLKSKIYIFVLPRAILKQGLSPKSNELFSFMNEPRA